MSWLYSRALVEEYSEGICLDGEPSVQSNGSLTPQAYLCSDKMMGFSRLSRFGMTFKLLTADRGEALLMSYLEDFPAKTSQQQEKVQGLMASGQVCGEKWQGSFAKYDPDTHSLRTHQCSLLEDSMSFCQTLPAWGLMRDGECWEQPTLELRIRGTESGSWLPTPLASDHKKTTKNKEYHLKRNFDLPNKLVQLGHPCSKSGKWGFYHPVLSESMMGWPLEWTDLKPLETDKFQQWQQQHGEFLQQE